MIVTEEEAAVCEEGTEEDAMMKGEFRIKSSVVVATDVAVGGECLMGDRADRRPCFLVCKMPRAIRHKILVSFKSSILSS